MIVSNRSRRNSVSGSRLSVPTEGVDHEEEIDYKLTHSYLTRTFNTSTIPFIRTNGQRLNTSFKENVCECPQVLIADDDSFNLSALETILDVSGLTCLSTFNGREALSAL